MTAAAARPARVLVVEDDPAGRELLEALLGEEGHAVESLGDGAEAWRRLEAGAPGFDVVLLDWTLPGLNGLDLLERIKSTAAFESIPVVFQTARTDRESVLAAVAAGAAYFVPKPIDRDLLRTVVAAAAADHQRDEALRESVERGAAAAATLIAGDFRFRTIAEATALATLLSRACPDPERTVVGLGELLINAVEHGNLGITYKEKSLLKWDGDWEGEIRRRLALPQFLGRRASVSVTRSADGVSYRIVDQGEGFDWQKFLDFDPERAFDPNGRGIAMARLTSFSSIEYEGCGNTVTARVSFG